jgi:hypothetical protein
VSEIASLIFGCLNGLISGVVFLLIIGDARPRSGRLGYLEKWLFGRRTPSGLRLAGKVAAIPALWLGAPLSAKWAWMFQELPDSYWIGLGIVFGVMVLFPLCD